MGIGIDHATKLTLAVSNGQANNGYTFDCDQ